MNGSRNDGKWPALTTVANSTQHLVSAYSSSVVWDTGRHFGVLLLTHLIGQFKVATTRPLLLGFGGFGELLNNRWYALEASRVTGYL